MRTFTITMFAAILLGGSSAQLDLSSLVGEKMRNGELVELGRLAAFQWDQVHIFSPYNERDRICERMPKTWTSCASRVPSVVDEGEFLVILESQGTIVHQELHRSRNGEYCETGCALRIPRDEAIFTGELRKGVYRVLRRKT